MLANGKLTCAHIIYMPFDNQVLRGLQVRQNHPGTCI